jgi:hypothetical protein
MKELDDSIMSMVLPPVMAKNSDGLSVFSKVVQPVK